MQNSLSAYTVELIQSLHAKKSLWQTVAHPGLQEEIIQKIADAGEPLAIPDLLPILLIANRRSVLACAEAIQRLLRQLKAADFTRFDEYVRQGYCNWTVHREPWYALKPAHVPYLASMGKMSASILGIASCHMNGHVREAAVRELGKIETGAELPFLLLRVNDWVEPIRLSATEFVLSRIRSDYVRHLLDWLPLAVRLGSARRKDHSAILGAVRSLMAGSEARQSLSQGFQSQDHLARRFCFEIALGASSSDPVQVLHQAFASKDQLIRKSAALHLYTVLPNDLLKPFLARARQDAWMAIRREALRTYATKYPAEADREYQIALLDANIAVREEAQYFLRKRGAFELRAYYLRVLENPEDTNLCVAIAGLGETGQPKDAELLEPFIDGRPTSVRVASIRAIGRLDPNSYLEQFLHALDEPNGKVAREALAVLSKKVNLIRSERLWEIYSKCRHARAKRGSLYLLARINKWDSIAFLVQSLEEGDDRSAELSRKYIARWFARYNRSFITPSPVQVDRLRDVLNRCGLLISPGIQRQLESLLERF